jgi:hypothetical protein
VHIKVRAAADERVARSAGAVPVQPESPAGRGRSRAGQGALDEALRHLRSHGRVPRSCARAGSSSPDARAMASRSFTGSARSSKGGGRSKPRAARHRQRLSWTVSRFLRRARRLPLCRSSGNFHNGCGRPSRARRRLLSILRNALFNRVRGRDEQIVSGKLCPQEPVKWANVLLEHMGPPPQCKDAGLAFIDCLL